MSRQDDDRHPIEHVAKPEQFLDPLVFLLDEHFRQRRLCDRLDELIESLETEVLAEHARGILDFMTTDLPLHMQDEERSLFPLLRHRCLEDDAIDGVLDRLSEEHDLDRDLVDFITADLETIANGHTLANPVRFFVNVREFSATQRRHLAWENSTIIPLAKRRLNASDLVDLGRAMAARRDIAYPG